MKILSCKTGYFLGFEKPLPNYLLNLKRSCLGSRKVEETCMKRLADVVNDEEPDIIALEEVDQGSMRTRTSGQIKKIREKLDASYQHHSHVNYGPGKILSRFPVFRNMSNAMLDRKRRREKNFLEPGSKQLLLEYRNTENNLSVFGAHLPTMHRFRNSSKRIELFYVEISTVTTGKKRLRNYLRARNTLLFHQVQLIRVHHLAEN